MPSLLLYSNVSAGFWTVNCVLYDVINCNIKALSIWRSPILIEHILLFPKNNLFELKSFSRLYFQNNKTVCRSIKQYVGYENLE